MEWISLLEDLNFYIVNDDYYFIHDVPV